MSSAPSIPTVWISGVSSGIGAAAVDIFLEAGWQVSGIARRKEALARLENQLRRKYLSPTLLLQVCDLNNSESVAKAFDAHRERFGRLDTLVNNAGYAVYGTLESLSVEAYRANMETNFLGAVRCIQAGLPLLRVTRAQKVPGIPVSIVNISSFVGKRAVPGASSYCASKFALEGLSEAVRLELAADGISVSVINPGVTETEFFEVAEGQRPAQYHQPKQAMSARTVAQTIFQVAKHPRRNVYLTLACKAGLFLQWLAPWLLDRIMLARWNK